MKNEILEKLKVFDDPQFDFDPVYHKYTYDSKRFISVTQLISRFHKPFESDHWSKVKADEAGVPQEFILNQWKQLNDYANTLGTATHNWIENYFNQIWQPLPNNLDVTSRINKFNILYAQRLCKLTPVKFEQRVYSKKWKIAGMIDSIFIYKDKIFILDWKTNKKFTTDDSDWGKSENLLHPFDDYFKNHQTEYSIQLHLYKAILKQYDIHIDSCYLVHIGPDGPAEMYKTKDMSSVIENYLDSIFMQNPDYSWF